MKYIFLLSLYILVSLTKVKKNGKELKKNLLAEVRRCVDAYQNLFVFSVDNMRTTKFIKVASYVFFKCQRIFIFNWKMNGSLVR